MRDGTFTAGELAAKVRTSIGDAARGADTAAVGGSNHAGEIRK